MHFPSFWFFPSALSSLLSCFATTYPQEGTLPYEPGPAHDSSQFSSDLGLGGDNCDCLRHHMNRHIALNLKSILLEATERSCTRFQGATGSQSSYKWLRDRTVVNAVILGI